MRDLRQRLMAIAKNSEAKRPESPPEVKAGETFFCREGIVPRAMLGDIDSVTLNDVCFLVKAGIQNICSFWIRKRLASAAAQARLLLKSARGGLNRAAWLSVNMSCGIMDRRPICCAKLLRSLHVQIQSSPSTGKALIYPCCRV